MLTDSKTIKSSNASSKNTKRITIFLLQIYTPYCVSHKSCVNENKKSSVYYSGAKLAQTSSCFNQYHPAEETLQ